jgi:hypothetical protein
MVALVRLAGRVLDVEHHAAHAVDGRVLLVDGLEPPVARGGRPGGVGIGQADLCRPVRLPLRWARRLAALAAAPASPTGSLRVP